MTAPVWLIWALGGCTAALGFVIAIEATRPMAALVVPSAQAPAVPIPPLAEARPQMSGQISTTLARPLFSAARRPPPPAPVEPEPTADPEPGPVPRLAGIVGEQGGWRALFQPGGDAKPILVGPGADVAGWHVEAIASDGVTLSAGGDSSRVVVPKPDPDWNAGGSMGDGAVSVVAPPPAAEPAAVPSPGRPQPAASPRRRGHRRTTRKRASGATRHP